MQPEGFDFILELQTYVEKENKPFERRHFHTLQEALINLLQIPTDRFWEANDPAWDQQISTVRILERRDGTEYQIAATFEMPISDVLPDGPSAGVYIHRVDAVGNESNIGELEDKAATSFYRLRTYDHDMPMVQIARYVYDDTLSLVADPAIPGLIEELHKKVALPWEYELQIFSKSEPLEGNIFFHTSMPPAFDQLINLQYFTPQPDGTLPLLPKPRPILILSDELGIPIITNNEKLPDYDDRFGRDMNLYDLEIGGGLGRMESVAGVNLSAFAGYHHEGYRIAIGSVDPVNHTFYPEPAFIQLQAGTLPPPSLQAPTAAFTLQLEYRPLQPTKLPDAITTTSLTSATYANLEDAVTALKKLDPESFDVSAAVRHGRDKYLYEAILLSTTEKTEIAKMFRVIRPEPGSPAGVFLKINENNLSTDRISTFLPFVETLQNKAPFLYLVRQEGLERHPPDRRRHTGPRHFGGGRSTTSL